MPTDEWWRIVDNEYSFNSGEWDITDWTHEREWRVKGNLNFEFKDALIHVILYNPRCVKHFLEKCPPEIIGQIYGITTLTSILM